LHASAAWPADRAVIDCFGNLETKSITHLLTAVGFSSPPSWIKPYQVLSGGERFRCDLAKAIAGSLEGDSDAAAIGMVVFDEFTSVVDRDVAQVGSMAIAEALRSQKFPCRFVAVSCHYDILDWLAPDWVVDMANRTCQRRRLRRPAIEVEVFRCRRRVWDVFAPHHYLSGTVSKSARCYCARWRGKAVSFCATIPLIGRRHHWRITRLVTLPDYQGIGIGSRLAEAVAEIHRDQGHRMNITGSHPALVAHCRRSPRWRTVNVMKTGSRRTGKFISNYRNSSGRAVVSFEYVGGDCTKAGSG
jgi:GNAT superfamily N-acetyltransferase